MANRKRILLVEDEESLRRSLKAFFEDEGFEVSDFASAEDALANLDPSLVAVAIVDMRLPGMDGNRFMEAAHRAAPALRFLVCTGSVGYALPSELSTLGLRPEHVFAKPVTDMTGMLKAVERLLALDGA